MRMHDGLQGPDHPKSEMPAGDMRPPVRPQTTAAGEMPAGEMNSVGSTMQGGSPGSGEMPTGEMRSAPGSSESGSAELREMPLGNMPGSSEMDRSESAGNELGEMPLGRMTDESAASGSTPAATLGEMPGFRAASAESGASPQAGSAIQLSGKWQLSIQIEA